MATKIRLQRFGRKSYAFYQIVIADSRAPRDGKFIERIGSYNPNTNPATIDLNFDRALYWLQTGAQPTDTARMILSREGVCMKKHLLDGVKKGAFDEAKAEEKFQSWLTEKKLTLQKVKDAEREKSKAVVKARLNVNALIDPSPLRPAGSVFIQLTPSFLKIRPHGPHSLKPIHIDDISVKNQEYPVVHTQV